MSYCYHPFSIPIYESEMIFCLQITRRGVLHNLKLIKRKTKFNLTRVNFVFYGFLIGIRNFLVWIVLRIPNTQGTTPLPQPSCFNFSVLQFFKYQADVKLEIRIETFNDLYNSSSRIFQDLRYTRIARGVELEPRNGPVENRATLDFLEIILSIHQIPCRLETRNSH